MHKKYPSAKVSSVYWQALIARICYENTHTDDVLQYKNIRNLTALLVFFFICSL